MTGLCTDPTWTDPTAEQEFEDLLTDPTWKVADELPIAQVRQPQGSTSNRVARRLQSFRGSRICLAGRQPLLKQGDAATTPHFALDSAPWLKEKLRQLLHLQRLRQAWHATGAAPPNALAIQEARRVLICCAQMDCQPQYIDPSVDEGVCISFRQGSRYADIECFNTGEILAAVSSDDGGTEIWEVSPTEDEINAALLTLNRFILQHEL